MNEMLPLAGQLGLVYRGGWHLPVARLWLTGQAPRHGLRFIGHAQARPRNNSKLLCHSQLAALWTLQARRVLPLPYGQPVQLGALALELLPTGVGRGAAMLRVQANHMTWIFVDAMRQDALPSAQQLSWRDADALVVYAAADRQDSLNAIEIQKKLAQASHEVWLLDDATLALDFASCGAATDGVRFAPDLNKLIHLGNLATDVPKNPRVVVWPSRARARMPKFAANWPTIHWRTGGAAPLDSTANPQEELLFSRANTGAALADCVRASKIARVLALGPGAESLRARCQSATCQVEVLHDIGQLQLM